MKYVKQFLIILLFSFLGEVLNALIPLPVPAGIYGILLLFLALKTGLLKLSSVRETGKFLLEIMPIMFIPAGVGLLKSWGLISASWVSYVIVIVVTTVAVLALSGLVTQFFVRRGGKKDA